MCLGLRLLVQRCMKVPLLINSSRGSALAYTLLSVLAKSASPCPFQACFLTRDFSTAYARLCSYGARLVLAPRWRCFGGADRPVGVTAMWVVCTASSSFLFLRRVQAVYADNKWIISAFVFLWMAHVGASFVVPFGSFVKNLATTGYCINAGIKPYVSATGVTSLVFDASVLIAVSFRLAREYTRIEYNDTENTLRRVFFTGHALPVLSKSLLQSGQQYFM